MYYNITIIIIIHVHGLMEYRIAGKFGGLAVYITTAKLKSAKISYSHIIRMAIPYRTAKFKSANIRFGAQPPNLMPANISGYTVYIYLSINFRLVIAVHAVHACLGLTL